MQAISTADTALITALCTLASAKRDRIRRVLLDRTSFRSAVDDSQSWIIDLIRAFMEAQYGEVTSILNKAEVRPTWLYSRQGSGNTTDTVTAPLAPQPLPVLSCSRTDQPDPDPSDRAVCRALLVNQARSDGAGIRACASGYARSGRAAGQRWPDQGPAGSH